MCKETVHAKCPGLFNRWWWQFSAQSLGQSRNMHHPVPGPRPLAGRRGADRSLDCGPVLVSIVKYDRLHFKFSWLLYRAAGPVPSP